MPAEDGPVRIAYALPKRIGSAVVRNRVRRRLRAAFATMEASKLRPGTYLVTADATVTKMPFPQLIATIERIFQALASR